MKIFYGVQGTGNGHISRARAINTYLRRQNVEVDFLFSGRAREDYFDMEEFGDWQCRSGLTFAHHKGKISTLKTLQDNNILRLWKDIRSLDLSGYNLVIHDFEPITAWAAKRQGIKTISLGHQYAFHFDIPMEGDSLVTRSLIRHFAPASASVGLHWHHFGHPILPPIVDLGADHEIKRDNFVLVYLGFETLDDILGLLHQCPDTHFICYGKFAASSQNKNVSLRPVCVEGFKRDLHHCSGVICNAGFELASEALQLGKKILVKPLHGQMEQLSNALALHKLGLGWRMNTLDAKLLQQWLSEGQDPRCQYPNVAKAIVEWLLTPQRPSVDELSQQLWGQTQILIDEPTLTPQQA